jgi:hypothetical protein
MRQKAYDTVHHASKLDAMAVRKIPWYLVLIVKSFLHGRQRRILHKTSGEHSDSFTCFGGPPQGSVLSPILHDVFIGGLLRQLEACRDGITVSGMHIPALALVSDCVLGM